MLFYLKTYENLNSLNLVADESIKVYADIDKSFFTFIRTDFRGQRETLKDNFVRI